jgi:hypothetical protein
LIILKHFDLIYKKNSGRTDSGARPRHPRRDPEEPEPNAEGSSAAPELGVRLRNADIENGVDDASARDGKNEGADGNEDDADEDDANDDDGGGEGQGDETGRRREPEKQAASLRSGPTEQVLCKTCFGAFN